VPNFWITLYMINQLRPLKSIIPAYFSFVGGASVLWFLGLGRRFGFDHRRTLRGPRPASRHDLLVSRSRAKFARNQPSKSRVRFSPHQRSAERVLFWIFLVTGVRHFLGGEGRNGASKTRMEPGSWSLEVWKRQPEKLDRRWLKDGCVGRQATMTKQSGDADGSRHVCYCSHL